MKSIKRYISVALSVCALFSEANAETSSLNSADYSIPDWTRLMQYAASMKPAGAPFSINMTVNGDPSTQMGFAWFTNPGVAAGMVQIVEKENAVEEDFSNPAKTFPASAVNVSGLNYSIEANRLDGITANQKKDYVSHKALATGLRPSTGYSFRVGSEESWSQIGHFTTASAQKDESYSFIYITDTQSQNSTMFDVSQKTVHAAVRTVPDASFILCNGDLVETSGNNNSEWEYEQWFSTMQDIWLDYPLVVTMGNHDKSANSNFAYHFNNNNSFNENSLVKADMDGTVFSFIRGDVLYMVINYENYGKEGYLSALADWMRRQVNEHKDVKWRVASFHKNMFTGSKSHQDDSDGKAVRKVMLPLFEELGINIAFQGHDHIYEVIGPVSNISKTLVESAVGNVEIVSEGGARENMTGKSGGVFDVSKGTLYFLNNSAGKKKYEPRDEQEMILSFSKHEIENYWGLFSGKFGQTGEPTFSKVEVSPNEFIITTYTVDDAGNANIFDSFKVRNNKVSGVSSISNDLESVISVNDRFICLKGNNWNSLEIFDLTGKRMMNTSESYIDARELNNGYYIIKAKSQNGVYSRKILLN